MNTLQKITKRAKQIQKAKPRTSWASARKQAGAEIKAQNNKTSKKVAKVSAPRSKPKKVVTTTRSVRIGSAKGISRKTVQQDIKSAKAKSLQELGELYTKKFVAKKVRDKKKLQKKIVAKQALIRRLSM